MADEEIVVKIEDAPPIEKTSDDAATIAKTGDENATTRQQDPVADLKAQYEDLQRDKERERERAEAAERREAEERQKRSAAERAVESARSELVDTRSGTIEQGLAAMAAETEAAEVEYASAMEAGDWKRAAKAQTRIATASANVVSLNAAKSDLEAARAATPQRDQHIQSQQQQSDDPVEAFIRGRTPPTANWLRDHRDYLTDSKKTAKLNEAHWNALGSNLQPDTKEYFEHVEKFLGLRDAPAAKPNGNGNGAKRPPVAPVVASGGGLNGGGNEVHLSRSEAAAATDGTIVWNYDDPSGQKRFKKGDPIGVQEFARRKRALTQQGQYDRTWVEQ